MLVVSIRGINISLRNMSVLQPYICIYRPFVSCYCCCLLFVVLFCLFVLSDVVVVSICFVYLFKKIYCFLFVCFCCCCLYVCVLCFSVRVRGCVFLCVFFGGVVFVVPVCSSFFVFCFLSVGGGWMDTYKRIIIKFFIFKFRRRKSGQSMNLQDLGSGV